MEKKQKNTEENARNIGYIAGSNIGSAKGQLAKSVLKGTGKAIKESENKGLGSKSEKEQEIEDLLSEEEKLEENYKRLEKQKMSDQGIVSPEELVEFGKDVYKGAKKGVKKVVGKVKEVVGKAKEKLK